MAGWSWCAGLACGAVIAAIASASGATQSYDAYKNFTLKNNPNGAWSYLVAGSPLNDPVECENNKKFPCWWNDEQLPDSAIVGANKAGQSISYYTIILPPKYLVLDPESLDDVAVQWTAPSAGSVDVTGNFLAVDQDEASHTVAILHNTSTLKSYTISAYGQKEKFHLKVQVKNGDTISFVNYSGGQTDYLSTGLQAKLVPN